MKKILLFLLLIHMPLFSLIGPGRPIMPWKPKSGASVSALATGFFGVTASVYAILMNKENDRVCKASKKLLDEKTAVSYEETVTLIKEYEKRAHAYAIYRKRYKTAVWCMVVFCLLAIAEGFNYWYWNPKRWKQKLIVDGRYIVGTGNAGMYLRAYAIAGKRVSCYAQNRVRTSAIGTLPSFSGVITKEEDLRNSDVAAVLKLIEWDNVLFNSVGTGLLYDRMSTYFASLYQKHPSIPLFAYVEQTILQNVQRNAGGMDSSIKQWCCPGGRVVQVAM